MRSRAKKGTRLCRSLSSYAREARRRPNRRQSSSYVLRSPGHRIRTRSGRRPLECARSSCSVLGSSSPESHALGERLRGFWMCGMRLWCRWRYAGIALLSRRLRYVNIPCMAVLVLAADAFMQYGRTLNVISAKHGIRWHAYHYQHQYTRCLASAQFSYNFIEFVQASSRTHD